MRVEAYPKSSAFPGDAIVRTILASEIHPGSEEHYLCEYPFSVFVMHYAFDYFDNKLQVQMRICAPLGVFCAYLSSQLRMTFGGSGGFCFPKVFVLPIFEVVGLRFLCNGRMILVFNQQAARSWIKARTGGSPPASKAIYIAKVDSPGLIKVWWAASTIHRNTCIPWRAILRCTTVCIVSRSAQMCR